MTGVADLRSGRLRTEDGATIAWWNGGTGSPLVLIAGQSLSHRSWLHVLPALMASHNVTLFDHRGMGADAELGAHEHYATELFADDVAAVMDAVGIDTADVYGYSMGGRIAQWLAIRHPHRVRRLVLGATTGGDEGGVQRDAAVSSILARWSPAEMAPLFFSPEFLAAQPAAVDQFFAVELSTTARRLYFQASKGHDSWSRLGEIQAPTLVLHGELDAVTPFGNAELLSAAIPGSRLRAIPGGLHGFVIEDAAATDAVLEFLRG